MKTDPFTALYVDDDPDLLEVGRIFMERDGRFHLDTASSATEAWERIRQGGYDAVISDYQMPGTDGIALLIQIRAKYPHLPFIFFTGNDSGELLTMAHALRADAVVLKGSEPKTVYSCLARSVCIAVGRRRTYQSSSPIHCLRDAINSTGNVIARLQGPRGVVRRVFWTPADKGHTLHSSKRRFSPSPARRPRGQGRHIKDGSHPLKGYPS